jgi:transglutaminase-like putative cysteine protease
MKFGLVFVAAALALLAGNVSAKESPPSGIKIGPVPAWVRLPEPLAVPEGVRGSVFARRNAFQIHLDRAGQWTFTSVYVRLLDSNALAMGNIAISWNPAAGTPIFHTINVHRAGVVRDALATAKFEILRREDQLEAAMLDGVLTATLRIPDLRVGDDLEVAYTLPEQDPTLGANSFGVLFISGTPPPGRLGLRLSWEPGQEPVVRTTPDITSDLKREPGGVWLSYDGWQRVIEFSDFATWPALSSRFSPLYSKAATLSPNSPVRSEAAAIAAAHSAPLDRAAAALKLVQQQVRYIYVGLNGGNLTPTSADETWQRRYGDCKAKTALLLALLGELGIEAEAVLANNSGGDDGIDQRLPGPNGFDHVLVRARIDGKTYWLDGTLPPDFRPTERAALPYRWVLPLSMAGAELERIAWVPETKPTALTLFEIDARGGFAEPAKKRTITILRGIPALSSYQQLSSTPDAQLEASVRQELEGSEDWTTIEKVTWRFDPAEQASIFEIVGTGPVDWQGERTSRQLALPGGGFNPPRRLTRPGSQGADIPYYIKPGFSCSVTTFRLPSTTAEKDWSYNTSFDRTLFGESWRRSFERRDGSIRMIRANNTLQPELDSAAAARDNALIAVFDNSMALIFYDPKSFDSLKQTERVPAVDEVDWLHDSSACSAPVLRGK